MKNKEDTLFMTIVVIVTIIAGLAAGIAQYRINAKNEIIEDLENQINVMQTEEIQRESDIEDVDEVIEENEKLEKENKELEKENEELQKTINEKQSYINYLYRQLN